MNLEAILKVNMNFSRCSFDVYRNERTASPNTKVKKVMKNHKTRFLPFLPAKNAPKIPEIEQASNPTT